MADFQKISGSEVTGKNWHIFGKFVMFLPVIIFTHHNITHIMFQPWLTSDKKTWPATARVDDAFGDQNVFCTCPPVEAYYIQDLQK